MGRARTENSGNPVKASAWYTVCSIIQKGISLILVPIYVRLMTTAEYGTYTLFQSWETIVLIFTTLNLAAYAFNNCLIQNEEKKDHVTAAFLGLIFALTAVVCVVFWGFRGAWESLFGFSFQYIIAMALDSMFTVAIDLWYARMRFDFRYKPVVAVTLFISIANMSLGIYLVSGAADKPFTAIMVKLAVQGFVTAILAIDIFRKGRTLFDWKLWKYGLLFNIPLIPHFLSTRILQQADRIMIQHFCGTAEAGIYGFSYRISDAMLIFNSAFLASMTPWTYKKLKAGKYEDIFRTAFFTIGLIGVLNLLLILLAPEVVAILGTDAYYEAVYIIPPVACSCYLMYLFNVFLNVTYYYEKNKMVVVASIVAAALNVGLNYWLIPKYGYLMAGYTTLVSYICLAIMHGIMSRYAQKAAKVGYKIYDMKKIILLSVIIIAVGNLTVFIYNLWYVRYAIVAAMLVVMFIKRKTILGLLRKKKTD